MAAKPGTLPRWATNDVVNSTSGQNNVVEPAEAIKDLGWDFKEKPPRQYFNWLGRWVYNWLKWIDDGDADLQVGTLTAKGTATGQTASAFADRMVVDHDGSGGISILSNAATIGSLFFGDGDNPAAGGIRYSHIDDDLILIAGGANVGRIMGAGATMFGISQATNKAERLWIYKGASGQAAASVDNDDMIIEGNVNVGLSFLSPNTTKQGFNFGDQDDATIGGFVYDHSDDSALVRVGGATAWRYIGGKMSVGNTVAAPKSTFWIYGGASGQAAVAVDGLVLENSDYAAISILSPNNKGSYLFFGNPWNNGDGGILFDNTTHVMSFFAESAESSLNDKYGIYFSAGGPTVSVSANALTPTTTRNGALWLDLTSGNGTLKCYSGGAWRTVAVL